MKRLALKLFAVLLGYVFLPGCDERDIPVDPRERYALQQTFNEARQLDAQGRYHEALVRYETILAQRPQYMSTRLNAAMAAYDSGQYGKAADHFEILHKYGPGDWFVIRKLIQCYERTGNRVKVEIYREKLEKLRQNPEASPTLKRYEGLTRDYIPVGSMHLIGYEFFDPKKHGRLWFFKLEDRDKKTVSQFLLQATPYHENDGRRMFTLIESVNGWMKVWHVGPEGRDYVWTRSVVLEVLQGKRQPLVTRPLPPEYEGLAAPSGGRAEDGTKGETDVEGQSSKGKSQK